MTEKRRWPRRSKPSSSPFCVSTTRVPSLVSTGALTGSEALVRRDQAVLPSGPSSVTVEIELATITAPLASTATG